MLPQGTPSGNARLKTVWRHRGKERPQALPFNATALLAENAGFGGKIVMQLVVRLSALVRTHRDSPP